MTRRERIERKVRRREEWAEKAQQESARRFEGARRIADGIPLGQPILVGHHSERRARRDQERIRAGMSKGCEAGARAARHNQVADSLAAALENNIFSDDADAVEQLRARIEEKTAKAERIKALNAAIRREMKKGDGWLERIQATPDELVAIRRNVEFDWRHEPTFPGYVLSNLRTSIRADQERIRDLGRRAHRTAEAEAAGGMAVKLHGEYAVITFAEKPPRETLDALKAAGYWWSRGSWCGRAEALPTCVKTALSATTAGAA